MARSSIVGLDNIKVSDEIGLREKVSRDKSVWRRAIVERVTATQLTVNGIRFRRWDGREIGYKTAYPRFGVAALAHRMIGGHTVADIVEMPN